LAHNLTVRQSTPIRAPTAGASVCRPTPMMTPNYAAQRSALAKQIGLGRPGALAEREQARGRRKAA